MIYSNSQLTIIAAAGSDTSCGLPGASRPRAIHQPLARDDRGLLIPTFPDASAMIRDSK